MYREPLLREGFELATASSGLEGLDLLRQRAPDVLVFDPQLPWGGGDGVLDIMASIPTLRPFRCWCLPRVEILRV